MQQSKREMRRGSQKCALDYYFKALSHALRYPTAINGGTKEDKMLVLFHGVISPLSMKYWQAFGRQSLRAGPDTKSHFVHQASDILHMQCVLCFLSLPLSLYLCFVFTFCEHELF
jgi:hypothetical protein